jgi:hypothetical protein
MQPIKEINYTIVDERDWTIGYTYKGYGYAIKRPGGGVVCNIAEGLRPEEAALATLISATPELLAALQRALPHLEDFDRELEHYGRSISETVKAARAAIAKATGGDA